ncbi:hypothetical protein [Haladaptatus sp. NG-SE-30]
MVLVERDRPPVERTTVSQAWNRYGRKTLVFDVALLSLVPTILVLIHYLTSQPLQNSLALNHRNVEWYTLWTHVYVHQPLPNDGHLVGNVRSYLLVASLGWLLSVVRSRRRQFWGATCFFLLVAPPLIAGFSYLVLDIVIGVAPRFDRGFSGIVGAFGGYLLLTVLGYVEANFETRDTYYLAGLFLILVAGGFGATRTGTLGVVFILSAVLLTLGFLLGVYNGAISDGTEIFDWGRNEPATGLLVCAGLFASALTIVGSFPAETVRNGGFVNIFAHAAGIFVGFVGASLPVER